MKKKIYCVDLETTRLAAISDSILEIGVSSLSIPDLTVNKEKEWIIQPKKIPDNCWAMRNTSLTRKFIEKNGHKIDLIRPKIQNFFSDKVFTAYNQNFDFRHLISNKIRPNKKIFCIMLKMKDIMKIPHDYYGYKYPSAEESLKYFGIEYSEYTHRALDDSFLETKILKEIIKKEIL